MTRLVTCGFETRRSSGAAVDLNESPEGEGVWYPTTQPTFDTSVQRSGGACVAFASGGTAVCEIQTGGVLAAFVLDRDYFIRFAWRRAGTATTLSRIFELLQSGGTTCGSLRWETDNDIRLYDNGGSAVGTAFATSVDTWYVVEIRYRIPTAGTTTWDWRVNGTAVDTGVTVTTGNTINNRIRIGHGVGAPGANSFADDLALNDDQGSNQNSWPGNNGQIVYLLPTALGAGGRGNWTDGGGGTTNLHEAVNNTPPTGTATNADGTAIENASSTVPSSAEFDTQTYTAAGVTGVVRLVCGLWRISTQSVTGTNPGTARLFGNPDVGSDTNIDFELTGAIAGTEPDEWNTARSAYVYNPSVTLGSVTQLRITKTTAATRVHACDFMATVVEYDSTASATQIDDPIQGRGVIVRKR